MTRARRALRPEPHERQPGDPLAAQGQEHEPLEDPLDGVVDGPARERPGLPVAEVGPLERPPQPGWHQAAQPVVRGGLPGLRAEAIRSRQIARVTLEPQVVDDLRRVEGHADDAAVRRDRRQGVVEPVDRHPGARPAGGLAVADRPRAEPEVAGVRGEVAGQPEAHEFLGAAVVVDQGALEHRFDPHPTWRYRRSPVARRSASGRCVKSRPASRRPRPGSRCRSGEPADHRK